MNQINKYTIKIFVDEWVQNPIKDRDMFGTFIHLERNSTLGHENMTETGFWGYLRCRLEEVNDSSSDKWLDFLDDVENGDDDSINRAFEILENSGWIIHEVDFMSMGREWIRGYWVASPDDIREDYMVKRISQKTRNRALDLIKAEVKEIRQYVDGEVYGYEIKEDGEFHDSLWGLYGYEYAKEMALDALAHCMK